MALCAGNGLCARYFRVFAACAAFVMAAGAVAAGEYVIAGGDGVPGGSAGGNASTANIASDPDIQIVLDTGVGADGETINVELMVADKTYSGGNFTIQGGTGGAGTGTGAGGFGGYATLGVHSSLADGATLRIAGNYTLSIIGGDGGAGGAASGRVGGAATLNLGTGSDSHLYVADGAVSLRGGDGGTDANGGGGQDATLTARTVTANNFTAVGGTSGAAYAGDAVLKVSEKIYASNAIALTGGDGKTTAVGADASGSVILGWNDNSMAGATMEAGADITFTGGAGGTADNSRGGAVNGRVDSIKSGQNLVFTGGSTTHWTAGNVEFVVATSVSAEGNIELTGGDTSSANAFNGAGGNVMLTVADGDVSAMNLSVKSGDSSGAASSGSALVFGYL